jgi:hypothetical protein
MGLTPSGDRPRGRSVDGGASLLAAVDRPSLFDGARINHCGVFSDASNGE